MSEQWAETSAHSNVFLTYKDEQDWFYMKWSGHIDLDDLVSAAKTYLGAQQEKHCPKLLNDKSELTGDWEEANDWLQYEWMPQVEQAGLKYMAIVLSSDMHDWSCAQNLQRRVSSNCKVALFYDLPAAKHWLSDPEASDNQ